MSAELAVRIGSYVRARFGKSALSLYGLMCCSRIMSMVIWYVMFSSDDLKEQVSCIIDLICRIVPYSRYI